MTNQHNLVDPRGVGDWRVFGRTWTIKNVGRRLHDQTGHELRMNMMVRLYWRLHPPVEQVQVFGQTRQRGGGISEMIYQRSGYEFKWF